MTRIFRQALLFVLLATSWLFLCLLYRRAASGLLDDAKTSLAKAGILFKAESLGITFPASIRIETARLSSRRDLELSFLVERAVLSPELSSLFALKLLYSGKLKTEIGDVELSISNSLLEDDTRISLRAQTLRLGIHPLARKFGFRGRLAITLGGSIGRSASGSPRVRRIRLALRLSGASYPGGLVLKGVFPFPAFRNLRLDVNADYSGTRLEIRHLFSESSLGRISGHGTVILSPDGDVELLDCRAIVKLTDTGLKRIGPYLSFLAGESPSTPIRNWRLKIFKEGKSPSKFLLTEA